MLLSAGGRVMTPNEIIDHILIREGGYVDHPADKGGPTNHGITQATLSQWRGKVVSVDDVRNLSRDEAKRIYRKRYIEDPGYLAIASDQVRSLVVDCAVNHGVARATKLLQQAAHVFPDGKLGPVTVAAVNRMTPAALYRRVCAQRARLYGEIITKNPSQAVFAAGWMNRLAEFVEETAQ
jgi:lysozyme family protein